jgi:hypothetical protein
MRDVVIQAVAYAPRVKREAWARFPTLRIPYIKFNPAIMRKRREE